MKRVLLAGALCLIASISKTQTYTGQNATKLLPGAEKVLLDKETGKFKFASFASAQANVPAPQQSNWLVQNLKLKEEYSFIKKSDQKDHLGYTHTKYQQLYQQIPVEGTAMTIHGKRDFIESFSGIYFNDINLSINHSINATEALQIAEKHVNAKILHKRDLNSPAAKLVILPLEAFYYLAYKTEVYALEPMSRQYIFVDAATGEILTTHNRIHIIDATGTAETRFSGVKEIITDSLANGFHLHDHTRGGGVITYDLNGQYDHFNPSDIVDSDNVWEAEDHDDNAALDAHWGTEMTYDYFLDTHGRNSYDNMGAPLRSYVHFGMNYSNAFWNGEAMTYGTGSGTDNPFTPLEVVAHEVTHGITEYTAGLIYQFESGALNESFSDIFGTVIDFYARGEEANYLMGDQVRPQPFRSMANPNLYNAPDTYMGNHWSYESYGVHTNSGVQNHWFYLLAEGGSGTNDMGDDYFVEAIGRNAAANIAYRNLSVYLNPYSEYDEAREFSIVAAIDLYGACSNEVIAVTNAWHAVGVGGTFDNAVTAYFNASDTYACEVPASIQFTDYSVNVSSWVWDFGDGATSTEQNPTHIYNSTGTYTVTLIIEGEAVCGNSDALTVENLVTVSDEGGPVTPSCQPATLSPGSNQGIAHVEFGTIEKSSGPSIEGYQDYTCSESTYLTEGHMYNLTVNTYGNEYVKIWLDLNTDGLFTSGEILYSSSQPVTVHLSDIIIPQGSLYNTPLRMRVQSGGSVLANACSSPTTGQVEDYTVILEENTNAPVAIFEANNTQVQVSEPVQFSDLSLNLPENWQWYFPEGIPTTSTAQHPMVQYTETGSYPVSLIVTNAHGADTLVMDNYISVVNSINMCETSSTSAINGLLYDSGGPLGNYSNGEYCTLLISPGCAQSITLTFTAFSMESCCDYLSVFDGPDEYSPLLLFESGYGVPSPVTAESGEMFIVFSSDFSVTSSGWEASWSSETPTDNPVAAFAMSTTNTPLNYPVTFTDQTSEFPAEWIWDFGDGNTSTEQNPQHIYTTPGVYPITLITFNCFGSDSIQQEIFVQQAPSITITPPDTLLTSTNCGSTVEGNFTIYNHGNGDLVVNPETSEFGNPYVQVLALVTNTDYDDEYEHTLEAINQHYTDYELSESWATNAAELAADLVGIDILLIPEQEYVFYPFFADLAPALVHFVNEGGKVLMCANNLVGETGLFDVESAVSSFNDLTISNIDHPILENVPQIFPYINTTRIYLWAEDDINTTLVHLYLDEDLSVVSIKSMGEGTVVYIGFDYQTMNSTNTQLIGNAMEYLATDIQPEWIESISMDTVETIAPGDSLIVTVQFDASGLLAGSYFFHLQLNPNDIMYSAEPYLLHLSVFGDAILNVNEESLDIGSVMAGLSISDTLIISNSGCQILSYSASVTSAEFSVQPESLDIPAYSQDTLIVTFQPSEAGNYGDILTILSNGGDALVTLSGQATPAPDIQITPQTIQIDLTACNDSTPVNFTINNQGEGVLNYNLHGTGGNLDIEEVLNQLNLYHTVITSFVPNIYNFSGGQTGNNIPDGGNDMYDNGNYLNTNYVSSFQYTNSVIVENTTFGPDSRYFTAKYPGLFILAADLADVDFFAIDGDLGADGSGNKDAAILNYTHPSGLSYKGFVTRVSNAWDPSVNHLIITKNSGVIDHTYFNSTNSDYHMVQPLSDEERLYYVLFASANGGYVDNGIMQNIFETFIDLISSDIANTGELNGSLEPGESVDLEVFIQTGQFEEGYHEIPLIIASNDPDQPMDTLWIQLNVSGHPCADFSYNVLGNCSGEVSYTDESFNNPTSWNWAFGDGSTSTLPNPVHTYDEAGEYAVTLEVCNSVDCSTTTYTVLIENVDGPLFASCTPQLESYYEGYYITNFEIAGISHSSDGNNTGYQDFSCSVVIPLNVVSTYTWNVSFTAWDYRIYKIWIDYNNDGIFGNNELVSVLENYGTEGSGEFTVPQNVTLNQPLRMRVVADSYLGNACGEIYLGEAEDYTVIITPISSPPVTTFSWTPVDECQGLFHFVDLSGNLPTSWNWNFGDGNTSNIQNPYHLFETGGEHTVQLTAYNAFGSNTSSNNVTMAPQGFDGINITGTQMIDSVITFTALGDGIGTWNWDFGDGNTGTSDNPSVGHAYSDLGMYTVTASTTDNVCLNSISILAHITITGIDNAFDANGYVLFPNPSNGSFHIILPQGEQAEQIVIYDAIGKEISFEQVTENPEKLKITVQNPVAGMYMLVLRTFSGNMIQARIALF